MKASRAPGLLLTLLMGASLVAARADEKLRNAAAKPPTEPELRAAIAKSLGFLARAGDQWMTDKNCNSCHHLPELLWSHREAMRRGFEVDRKKFDQWLQWSDEHATDKKAGLEIMALTKLAMPERPVPELDKLIVAEQKPDGTWDPANQFATMQKRGPPDARSGSTQLLLLALATAQPEPPAASAKATALPQFAESATSIETLVFRSLLARHYGSAGEADIVCTELIKLQRGDGGWSSVIGENQSDPLATGEALYALQPSSLPQTAEVIARARHWLLDTQRGDGSWPIDISHISKIDRSAPAKAKSLKEATDIYIYWGTAWATIGLLQGVPVK